MRNILIAALLVLGLSGCFEIEETIQLNKDGSGKYSLHFDYSQLLQLSLMFDEEEGTQDDQFKEMDEVLSMSEINPEAIAGTKHPEFWKKVFLKSVINKETLEMHMTYFFDFQSTEEINFFMNELVTFNDQMAWYGVDKKQVKLKGKKLERLAVLGIKNLLSQDEEEGEMMKMMMTDAKYTTTYIFPGAVKSSTIPNSEITGNQLTVVQPLLRLMDDDSSMNGTIKFKKK